MAGVCVGADSVENGNKKAVMGKARAWIVTAQTGI
jgi:hypothetical protein